MESSSIYWLEVRVSVNTAWGHLSLRHSSTGRNVPDFSFGATQESLFAYVKSEPVQGFYSNNKNNHSACSFFQNNCWSLGCELKSFSNLNIRNISVLHFLPTPDAYNTYLSAWCFFTQNVFSYDNFAAGISLISARVFRVTTSLTKHYLRLFGNSNRQRYVLLHTSREEMIEIGQFC